MQSLTFDQTYKQTQTEELAVADRTRIITLVAEIIGGLLLLAALFWYISRLLKNLKVASISVWEPVLKPAPELSGMAGGGYELAAGQQQAQAPGLTAAAAKSSNLLQEATARISPKTTTVEEQKMQALLTRLAEDNPASVADVIQMWLNQDKKNG